MLSIYPFSIFIWIAWEFVDRLTGFAEFVSDFVERAFKSVDRVARFEEIV